MSMQNSPDPKRGTTPTGLNRPIESTSTPQTGSVAQPGSIANTGLHRASPNHTPSEIAGSNRAPAGVGAPTPVAKRPKGRLFITTVLLGIVGTVCYFIYDSYCSTIAYGSVTARVIRVSPQFDGTVRSIHVVDGDTVRKGDILATLDSAGLQRKLDEAGDRLKIARSEATAAEVQTKRDEQQNEDRKQQRFLRALSAVEQAADRESEFD